jgi:ABC-type dipeptide/oligopeptide/nickel transport system permease subunit
LTAPCFGQAANFAWLKPPIAEARFYLAAGLAITITTLAVNLVGEKVRDVLDPDLADN